MNELVDISQKREPEYKKNQQTNTHTHKKKNIIFA